MFRKFVSIIVLLSVFFLGGIFGEYLAYVKYGVFSEQFEGIPFIYHPEKEEHGNLFVEAALEDAEVMEAVTYWETILDEDCQTYNWAFFLKIGSEERFVETEYHHVLNLETNQEAAGFIWFGWVEEFPVTIIGVVNIQSSVINFRMDSPNFMTDIVPNTNNCQ